jgi:hypothetical protein
LRGFLAAAGFLGAAFFFAGATDLTTASEAFTATGVGAGAGAASTLYGVASGCVDSADLAPKSLANNFNIVKSPCESIYSNVQS